MNYNQVKTESTKGLKFLSYILIFLIVLFIFLMYKGNYFHNFYYNLNPSYVSSYGDKEISIKTIPESENDNTEKPVYIIQFERTNNSEKYISDKNYILKYVELDSRKVGVIVAKENLKYFKDNKELKVKQRDGILTLANP